MADSGALPSELVNGEYFQTFAAFAGIYRMGAEPHRPFFFWLTPSDLERIDGFRLTLTGFPEFCYPQGFKLEVAPGFEIPAFNIGDREVYVWKAGKYLGVFKDSISANLMGTDAITGKDVELTVVRKDGEAGAFYPHIRQDVEWALVTNYSSPQSATRVLKDVCDFLAFVSHLLQRPVAPITIETFVKIDGRPQTFPALITRLMHPAALKAAVHTISANHIPLQLKELDFHGAFESWSSNSDSFLFRFLVDRISSHSGIVYTNDAYSRLIMICTLLEDGNAACGGPGNEKFMTIIKQWAYLTTQEELIKAASVSTLQEFVEFLSAIRNEIAHTRRPRHALVKTSEEDLFRICDLLEATLFSYSLHILGVKRDTAIHAQLKVI
jgi:hypothetical protein